MKYLPWSECPPFSVVLFHRDGKRIVAHVDPLPADDGKLYVPVSTQLATGKDWHAMWAAVRQAGWRMKKWGCVSFADTLIYELVPVKKAVPV